MAESFDVLIIGGGISGVSLAARLAGRLCVAVVEAEEHLGTHATGRSAALLVEAYGPPVIRVLTGQSRSFFERPPAGFSESPLARRRGSLVYAGEGDIDQLRSEFESAGHTTEAVWLDAEAVLRACPLLKPGVAAAGFLEPEALDLDANGLLQGFARATLHAGASIWKATPLRSARRQNGSWRVIAGEREITAGVLVDAAGPWADSVAASAGASPLGLQPMRRTAATVEVPGEFMPRLAETPLAMPVDQSFYFKPEASAIMVSLSEETPSDPCDAWPDDFDVALALDRFHAATIVPPVRPTAAWAGLRTFAPDRNPVVGFDAVVPDLFWYAGQGGYGIQTSPALSALGARLILGDPLDEAEAAIATALSSHRFGSEAPLTPAL